MQEEGLPAMDMRPVGEIFESLPFDVPGTVGIMAEGEADGRGYQCGGGDSYGFAGQDGDGSGQGSGYVGLDGFGYGDGEGAGACGPDGTGTGRGLGYGASAAPGSGIG